MSWGRFLRVPKCIIADLFKNRMIFRTVSGKIVKMK
jgi:hypothetical protein